MNQKHNNSFCPSLCVTHNCNLNCVYCYQHHDIDNRMSLETAKACVDWIFDNVPQSKDSITLTFIGGEPLLEFALIKDIYDYIDSLKKEIPVKFFATTNGTVLSESMKKWFASRKDKFVLGLSLDGTKESHNFNRSDSFEKIDIEFFKKNWPKQGIKMTISEESIKKLADNVIFLHELGFERIDGVNLYEGTFDWDKDEYIKILVPQLKRLVEYYVSHPEIPVNQMFRKNIELCATKSKEQKKYCGIGENMVFFDTDGKRYPCAFVTPMTFSHSVIELIKTIDFSNDNNFIDEECYRNCYIYPICATCAGANYLVNNSFKVRNKSKCRINKLISLFIADLLAKRITNNPNSYKDETLLYYTIQSIKEIRNAYYVEFSAFL